MSIASAITRFRTRQAAQFSDTVTVRRQVGEASTDSITGGVTRNRDVVYSGPCKVRPADRSGFDVHAGETEFRRIAMVGKFPVDQDIRKDDLVTVTASTFDATMVGRQYRVTDHAADGWQIAKVVGLEELLVPVVIAAEEEGS